MTSTYRIYFEFLNIYLVLNLSGLAVLLSHICPWEEAVAGTPSLGTQHLRLQSEGLQPQAPVPQVRMD